MKYLFCIMLTLVMSLSLSAEQSSISHSEDYKTPEIFKKFNTENEKLYLIGWSNKGDLAYIKFYVIEGRCGYCPFYDLIIQSIVTDKAVYSKKFDAVNNKGTGVLSLDEMWKNNYSEIKKSLQQYNIIQYNKFTTGMKKFSYNSKKYSIDIKYIKKKVTINCCMNSFKAQAIQNLLVTISSPQLGSKVIYRQKNDYGYIDSVKILGFVHSPFDERIAVLCLFKYIYCEESRSELLFIGSHLTTGFNKK